MSRVYKGYHERLRREVAVKVISSGIAASADFRARFEREAQLIASLEHPNIVTVYDFGESDDITYLVMQYVSGGTLRDLLSSGQPMMPLRAARYALQMAQALHHAHLRGIVHRDVKPGNMLVSANDPDTLLLSDFGIAKLFDTGQEETWPDSSTTKPPANHTTNASLIVGTPQYMAPEQVYRRPVDARTDVYALGTVLFQMLTGRVPFQSTTYEGLLYQQGSAVPPSVREINPSIPEALALITTRALEKSPAARFQSADAMAQALEAIVTQFPTTYNPAPRTISVYQPHSGKLFDPDPTDPNLCPKCGNAYMTGAAFCAHCGHYLLVQPTQQEQTLSAATRAPGLTSIDSFPAIQGPVLPEEEARRIETFSGNKCTFCGAEIRPGDNFCLNCGNRLLSASPSLQQGQPGIGDRTFAAPADWSSTLADSYVSMDDNAAGVAVHIENPARLILRSSEGEILQEYVLDRPKFVIGRAPNSDILLSKDKLTSRRQATIQFENGQYMLCDERSANGTFINGQQIEDMTPYLLRDGDHVSVGEYELVFLAGATSGVEDFPTVAMVEEADEGTIGTRFTFTVESTFATAQDANPPEVQVPVEEIEPFVPDATGATPPYSTIALDQTIAQLLEEGEKHYKAKHYEDALAVYKRIIRMDSRNVQAHGNRGNVLGRLRQYKEALAAYEAALNIDTKHVSIWNAKGDVLFKLRRYEEALKAYNAALAIKPNDVLTLSTKGDVLLRLKRYEEALVVCNQALSIAPTHARTWIIKGNVLSKQRLYEDALVAYDTALGINPKDASTWTTKGNMLLKLERYDKALEAYTCAAELVPRKPQIWAARGEVLLQLKRYEEALVAYERSHVLNPGDIAILRKYSLLRELKRHKEELAQVQAKEKPTDNQAAEQAATRILSNNEARTGDGLDASRKDQEQKESFGREADSTRVFEGFDIFLSYADVDTKWVGWIEDELACPLEDKHEFQVWLPKWYLIPGKPWRIEWDCGMEQSRCYAICVSGQTPIDWFKQEVERAFKRKQVDPSFKVLAVLLPDADAMDVDAFPELTTWVDFCHSDHTYAFHVLVCGVKGVSAGPPSNTLTNTLSDSTSTWTSTIAEVRLRELQQFKQGNLIDESIAQEFQRIVLKKIWLDIDESKG